MKLAVSRGLVGTKTKLKNKIQNKKSIWRGTDVKETSLILQINLVMLSQKQPNSDINKNWPTSLHTSKI